MSGLVLIVDDDEALSENLAEIVGDPRACETMIARDRETALALAAAHDFDVALIDVRLPDGDGMSLLAPLRARSPVPAVGDGDRQRVGRGRHRRRARRRVRLRSQAGLAARPARHHPARARTGGALPRARAAARTSSNAPRRRHRELVESVPAFVLALDEAGKITTWNRELERVTGYPRAEMLGTDGRRFVGPGPAPASICRSRPAASARSAGAAPR